MSHLVIDKAMGRAAFGMDPAGYHAARPDYPEWVFETLRARCGLGEGTATFEIGAGTGKATRRLLDCGARPLIAFEPDTRLAAFLEGAAASDALTVVTSAFEDAALESGAFDLGTSATAFHWLDERSALQKIADALRPGGWWAPFWNIFGDRERADAFHEATKTLLADGPISPSNDGHSRFEFGADKVARLAALQTAGTFDEIDVLESKWSIELDPQQTMRLYATYSNITLRPDRERILDEIGRIAETEFGGRVTRNMTTVMYVARRCR